MEGALDLGTLAELGIALVGFAALIAVFRGGSISSWHPRARLAFWYIICHGLGAVFFSLLPSFLAVFGPGSWLGASLAVGVFHGLAYGVFVRQHLSLLSAGIPTPNNWFYWLNGGVVAANAAVLGLSAVGLLGGSPETVYGFGVASCILLAGAVFVAVLRLREQPSA